MSPEDREFITTSITNLWALQGLIISRLLVVLRDEGALSPQAIERLLQELDSLSDVLDGEDDRSYATGLLASVRTILARTGP